MVYCIFCYFLKVSIFFLFQRLDGFSKVNHSIRHHAQCAFVRSQKQNHQCCGDSSLLLVISDSSFTAEDHARLKLIELIVAMCYCSKYSMFNQTDYAFIVKDCWVS
jgi:hypothetical protein